MCGSSARSLTPPPPPPPPPVMDGVLADRSRIPYDNVWSLESLVGKSIVQSPKSEYLLEWCCTQHSVTVIPRLVKGGCCLLPCACYFHADPRESLYLDINSQHVKLDTLLGGHLASPKGEELELDIIIWNLVVSLAFVVLVLLRQSAHY